MTGFARASGAWRDQRWAWEVRSVNARGLDMRLRLPSGFEMLEPAIRALASERLKRGSLNATLAMPEGAAQPRPRLNRAAFDALVASAKQAAADHGLPPPGVEGFLALRGIVEFEESVLSEDEQEERSAAIGASFTQAIDDLVLARQAEGEQLRGVLEAQIGELASLVGLASASAEAQPEALRERLKRQIGEILDAKSGLDEARLAQELALLAVKCDVREELDRLRGHVEAARALLEAGGVIGRKFDFLTQEFGREANTLCSKATTIDLTRIGLDLKGVIDRIREQVQNIE